MILNLTLSDGLGYASVMVAFSITLYALRRIWLGLIKPHAFSVLIWAIVTGIAFFNMLVQDLEATAYRTGLMAVLLLVNFAFCLRQGFGYITKIDWVFLTAALATIPIWLTTGDPNIALYWLLVIELSGTMPTVRKAWVLPYDLSALVYFFVAVAQTLQLLSLMTSGDPYSVAMFLYMISFPVLWIVMSAILLYRRKILTGRA